MPKWHSSLPILPSWSSVQVIEDNNVSPAASLGDQSPATFLLESVIIHQEVQPRNTDHGMFNNLVAMLSLTTHGGMVIALVVSFVIP